MEYLTIELPVRRWQRIDGTVDNSIAVDVVEAVMETVMIGACVRDAGWRASAAYSGALDDIGWPPPEHLLAITLQRGHWQWVLTQMERWEAYETDSDGGAIEARTLINDGLRIA